MTSDSAPLFPTPADVSMPLADASVDALGNSLAQAAYPYPGDTAAVGVTGVAAPNLPAGVTPPAAPANETTSYPSQPSSHLDAMAYQLFADSAQHTSTATASSMAASTTASAATNMAAAGVTIDPASGLVTATASAMSAPLAVGPLMMGAVTTHVTLTRLPGQGLTRDVAIDVGQSSVMGQAVDIGPNGLTIPPGGTTALPGEASAVTQMLSAAGVSVTYLAEIDSPDGTVAPGVQVTQKQVQSTGQTTTTTYVLGQSAASARAGGQPAVVTPPAPVSPPAASPKASAPPRAATPSTAAVASGSPSPSRRATPSATSKPTPRAPVAASVAPSAGPPSSAVAIVASVTNAVGAATAPPVSVVPPIVAAGAALAAPETAPSEPAPSVAPVLAAGTAAQTTASDQALIAERRLPDSFGASATSFYLVLVLGGLVLLASSASVRALGVRLLWTR